MHARPEDRSIPYGAAMNDRGPSERPLAPRRHLHPDGSAPQKPTRVACRDCRQAKVRCDGQSNGVENPCRRCRRLSLACEIDTNYKRVNKRMKINELAEEVERLRSAVHRRETDALVNSVLGESSKSSPNRPQQPQPLPSQPLLFPQRFISSPRDSNPSSQPVPSTSTPCSTSSRTSQSRSLEHVHLDKGRINGLFDIFFKNYHPFLAILDANVSADEYYARCPLLFWSIIAIAARQYQQDATLHSDLTPCVSRMMWGTISVLPHTLFIVQAILLLSVWSFSTKTLSTDPSFILVSIAKSASMQLGLHRPHIIQDFLRIKTQLSPGEFQDAVKTWIGAFIAAQSVTASIGQSSIINPDWVIEAACETNSRYTVPQNLRHHLLISKFIIRINCIMAEDKRFETGYPLDRDICVLLNVLEQDFIDLEVRIGKYLSEGHQILLAMSSLQLRSYYFFVCSNHDIRRQGLLKAYTTSVTLISKAAEADENSEFFKYAPSGYSQFLAMAAVLIMKIVHSSYSKYINTEAGKCAFNTLLWKFRKTSIEEDDLLGRTSKVLTNLWSFHQSWIGKSIQEEPMLNMKTRLGASLLHDSLWTWREEFGGQRGAVRAAAPDISNHETPKDFDHQQSSTVNFNAAHQVSEVVSDTLPQQSYKSTDPNLENPNCNFDIPDLDWLWDVGFPSFLPMEFNTHVGPPSGFQ